MLEIKVPATECFNDDIGEFYTLPPKTIKLEHSLISISKWESKWHKPFLIKKQKTEEETIDYIKCMSIGTIIDDDLLSRFSPDNIQDIKAYIEDTMTATYVNDEGKRTERTITSELIYAWMIILHIPVEFEKWHLNRLLTLIQVVGNEKNNDGKRKPLSSSDIAARKAENARRRAKYHTRG